MVTKTMKRTGTNDSVASLTAESVLQEQQQAARRALAEAALYRRIVHEAVAGTASDGDIQAAQIIGHKWSWDWASDVQAVQELNRLSEKYGEDIRGKADQLWADLTAKASDIRELEAATRQKLHAMEVERQAIQSRHNIALGDIAKPDSIRQARPHLFGSEV